MNRAAAVPAAPDGPDMLVAALELAGSGLLLVPEWEPHADGSCTCMKGRACSRPGKHPRVADWRTVATRDPVVLRDWFTRWPNANIGCVPRADSGIVAFDVDVRSGGDNTLADLEARFGQLPQTWTEITPGGGLHHFFRLPDGGATIPKFTLGPGFEIIGDTGKVTVTPSLHASGARYQWEAGGHPDDGSMAELPAAWLEMLIAGSRGRGDGIPRPHESTLPSLEPRMRRARAYLARIPGAVSGDHGHDRTFSAAVALVRGFCLPEREALALLREDFNPRCRPRWSDADLQHKVTEAASKSVQSWAYLLKGSSNGNRDGCQRESGTSASNAPALSADDFDEWRDSGEKPVEDDPAGLALAALRRRFFDEAPSTAELLTTPPPLRRWLIKDLVPAGVAGMLIGQGGVGKGMLELLVAVRIASGFNLGPFQTTRGRVLVISREDDREELHRRLVATVRAIDPHFGPGTSWREDVVENLHLIDLVGVPKVGLDEALIDVIAEKCRAIGGVDLIVLDPLGRLLPDAGMDLNSQADASRILDQVNVLVRRTGATVLLVHHVNKLGRIEKKDDDNQTNATSGSHMFDDLSRVVLRLAHVGVSECGDLGLDRRERHVKLWVSKGNYGPGGQLLVFRKRPELDGALECQELRSKAAVDDERVLAALVQAFETSGQPLSREAWVKECKELEPSVGKGRADDARRRLVVAGLVEEESAETAMDRGRAPKVYRPRCQS